MDATNIKSTLLSREERRRKTDEDSITTRLIKHRTLSKYGFNINKSFKRLLLPGLARCLISLILIGGFYGSLWGFKDRVISPRAKSVFDAITVALSVAFGLNIASALKAIALDLRWWILSKRRRSSEEVEKILRCDGLTELLRLMVLAPRPKTLTACISWVLLNLLAQAAIAVLGLTYSASPGLTDIFRERGTRNVSVPDMTTFAPKTGRFGSNAFVESYAAHVLGDIGSSYRISPLPKEALDGTPFATNPAGFWNATDHWEYIFLDSAPPPPGAAGINFLSIYSNRTVRSAGNCSTPPFRVKIKDKLANVQLLNENRNFTFPALALGLESISYLTSPILDNDNTTGRCGPGCNRIQAIEPAAGPPIDPITNEEQDPAYYFYDCNVTVTARAEDLPLVKAAIAAQAIALSGQKHPDFLSTPQEYDQFTEYNFGTAFGDAQNNSAIGMASLISRFAMGVISAAAQTNPQVSVPGRLPAQGIRLQLDSETIFHLILIVLVTLQFVFVIVTAIIVSRIVFPEDIQLSHQENIQEQFVLREPASSAAEAAVT